jgi:ABC-type transport system involved in cytochrome bd biosynthesis fused ATPase/permease subunit
MGIFLVIFVLIVNLVFLLYGDQIVERYKEEQEKFEKEFNRWDE